MTLAYCGFAECFSDTVGEHHDLRTNTITCPLHSACLIHGGVHYKLPVFNCVIKDLSAE